MADRCFAVAAIVGESLQHDSAVRAEGAFTRATKISAYGRTLISFEQHRFRPNQQYRRFGLVGDARAPKPWVRMWRSG